jgi:hypothetical protein
MAKKPVYDDYDAEDELREFTVTVVARVSVSARSRGEAETQALSDAQNNPTFQEWHIGDVEEE